MTMDSAAVVFAEQEMQRRVAWLLDYFRTPGQSDDLIRQLLISRSEPASLLPALLMPVLELGDQKQELLDWGEFVRSSRDSARKQAHNLKQVYRSACLPMEDVLAPGDARLLEDDRTAPVLQRAVGEGAVTEMCVI